MFSDESFEDKEAGFTTIEVHGAEGGKDNYHTIIQKMRKCFELVLQRVAAGTLSFDFLTVSPDDAFWILPNLKTHLATDRHVQERFKAGKPMLDGHIFEMSTRVS